MNPAKMNPAKMNPVRSGWLVAAWSVWALVGCSTGEELDPAEGAMLEARSTLERDTSPDVSDASYGTLIADNNAFAFDLYHELATGSDNLFYSPLSISVALAMTYAGAKATTKAEMAAALHYSLPQAELHPAFNQLTLELDSRNIAPHQTTEGDDKSVRVSLVNAAWAQQGYEFVPTYLDTLAVHHGAGVKLLDFSADPAGSTDIINAWVAQQTEDKIQDLIPDGALDSLTRLVLTNTLYFYANWATVFDTDMTHDEVFHAPSGEVTVPTMHGSLDTAYAEGNGWQMAELPYDGEKLSMTIILPDAGRFDEIRNGLTADWFTQSSAAMQHGDLDVSLPKFRFTWGTTSLKPALEAFGMVDAFDGTRADFSGMATGEQLYIADVLHQAFVGVDESGTEAAAATAVIMFGNAEPAAELIVDRPFVFLIRDVTGTLLFVGQVTNPTAS
ncbi:MAG: serpin family protein [Deltaproteobacteria bacterium]|nr:MAG: serpin family protein [Deltaproteobacteria bacterium]